MAVDGADGRAELWRRYDAGDLSADELEARLGLLDRADDADEAAIGAALDGPVPLHRRRSSRRAALVAVAAAAILALVGGVLFVADAVGGDDGSPPAAAGGPVLTVVPVPGGPAPPPLPPPQCDDLTPALDLSGETPASDALLSDPPFVPEGYEHADDDDIEPGTDPDIAMSTAAGTPAPVEIAARELDGHLVVRLRTFRFSSPEDARASAESVAATACSFGATRFDIPDRPELTGTVVSGPIPTTAFASWNLGDRRFIVAVESDGDEPDDLAEAQDLAAAVAGAELDAARNPAPAAAP